MPAKLALMREFPKLSVFVIGDIMLDRYLVGDCDRISPEAPVQVVKLNRRFSTLGGAANVAANLAALHIHVELAGIVGDDEAARELKTKCADIGISTSALQLSIPRGTIVKTRVLASDRQLLRLDEEDASPITDLQADELVSSIISVARQRKPNAVILSDYAKGVLTPYACQKLIEFFASEGTPTFVDPKGKNYEKYRGVTCIKPNRSEMMELAKALDWPHHDAVEAAQQLRCHLGLEFVALTLGAQGMALISDDGVHRVPTMAREVFDVSGAGDTVMATMVAALSAGLDRNDSLVLATLAAAEVISHVGSRPIQRDELLLAIQNHSRGERGRKRYEVEDLKTVVGLWKSQGLVVGFTNGCFDLLHAGHVTMLEDATSRVDRLIVAINSDASVRRLKGESRPLMSEDKRVTVLSALEAVDAVVVFEEDTPLQLLEALLPDVLFKGGDYTRETVVGHEIIEQNGGRIELVPLVPGVSTSYLADRIEKL
ncbi:MAG: D-glycero-beta-D-manno-heptose 1-phosphate adenylyltransferase [Fimbriimonas sp.]|nr:D-glycero-beta-D-manno-heptose 1-phosphate adenylyltransferase [Fimbriimonas sp.]